MRVLSVNIGQRRQVETPRGIVLTSIFKSPVQGRIPVRGHSLVGDTQSDLTVHGGPTKAIYAYPFEHYPYWAATLHREISYGNFGENLTTEGLLESDIHVGDQYRIGTALLQVTKPRQPCYKLALRFNLPTMVKLFWNSGFSGFYFSVVEEGDIAAGDTIELVERNAQGKTIAEVTRADREKAHS
jgi:MOSC domain-containing protein YiiM